MAAPVHSKRATFLGLIYIHALAPVDFYLSVVLEVMVERITLEYHIVVLSVNQWKSYNINQITRKQETALKTGVYSVRNEFFDTNFAILLLNIWTLSPVIFIDMLNMRMPRILSSSMHWYISTLMYWSCKIWSVMYIYIDNPDICRFYCYRSIMTSCMFI